MNAKTTEPKVIEFKPQPGPQTLFLSSPADVVIYGGAAGGGKSFGIILECGRFLDVEGFGAVVFRRTLPQITNEGSLWDTAKKVFPYLGGTPNISALKWVFKPHGTGVKFAGLEHEMDVIGWDSSQIPLICFDQLESFTKYQFTYMLSRNRSVCGVKPYVRASCNPKPGSWLLELIGWWIDEKGYPIKSRSGQVRWFVTVAETFVTSDKREELVKRFPKLDPKSFTFIHADLDDNKILTTIDPGYRSNLMALPEHERERLLNSNWKIRREGKMFKWTWFKRCDPDKVPAMVRLGVGVDPSGGTEDHNDMQGIVSAGLGRDGNFYVFRDSSCKLKPLGWARVACEDYEDLKAGAVVGEKNYGGDMVESNIKTVDKDVVYKGVTASRGKAVRAEPVASLYENGKVFHVGHFEELEAEMVNFDPDDRRQKSPNRMDALVWAIDYCRNEEKTGILELYKRKAETATLSLPKRG